MSKTSKTTQENKPPEWAAPLFKKAGDEAGKIYDSGAGGQTYQGSTVSPLSKTTMGGVNQLAQAGQSWDTSGTRPLYQGLGEQAVSQNAGALDDYASGKFLNGEGNPFYRQRLEKEIGDSNSLIRSQFSGSGRYGGVANQNVIADNTSNMLLSGLEDDYNRQQANQFSAMGLQGQALDRATGIVDKMSGQDQQQFTNRLTGAGATLQAGGILDQQAQKQLSDQVAKWYANDNQDWTRLGMLTSAAAGAAGPYGNQVATSRQPVGIGGILSGLGGLMGK